MKTNSQSIRTSKAITNALISLLKGKPFEKITVQDILDRTPVTRATFYAHFHDKYEIIEKLYEYFLTICDDVRTELQTANPVQKQLIIQKSVVMNRDLLETLLKVRTDTMDLRELLTQNLKENYIQSSSKELSPSLETEARIYSQARLEAYLAFLYDDNLDYSVEYMNSMYLSVSLKLLKLSDDQETIEFLKRKLQL